MGHRGISLGATPDDDESDPARLTH